MNLHLKKGSPLQQKTACLVLGVFEGKFKTPLLKELDQALDGALGQTVRDGEFTGKVRETVPEGSAERVHCDVWVEKDDGSRVALGTASAVRH